MVLEVRKVSIYVVGRDMTLEGGPCLERHAHMMQLTWICFMVAATRVYVYMYVGSVCHRPRTENKLNVLVVSSIFVLVCISGDELKPVFDYALTTHLAPIRGSGHREGLSRPLFKVRHKKQFLAEGGGGELSAAMW